MEQMPFKMKKRIIFELSLNFIFTRLKASNFFKFCCLFMLIDAITSQIHHTQPFLKSEQILFIKIVAYAAISDNGNTFNLKKWSKHLIFCSFSL